MHSFDPLIAQKVGVNAAVLYQNIVWWCAKNAANNENQHEGRFWTYNSVRAWGELFPYMTAKQIRSALERLEESGLVLSGCFNKSGYDRTKWFCPSGQPDLPSKANEIAPEGQPIPVIKPVVIERGGAGAKPTDRFQEFWDQYPHRGGSKKGRAPSEAKYRSAVKGGATETEIIAGALRYANDAQVIRGYAKDPSTWLNQKGWTDEVEPTNTGGRSAARRQDGPDPVLANILRLARLRPASGNGGA